MARHIIFDPAKSYNINLKDGRTATVVRTGKQWTVTPSSGKPFKVSDCAELESRFGKLK